MYRNTALTIAAAAALLLGMTNAGNALAGGWTPPPVTKSNTNLRPIHPPSTIPNRITTGRISCPKNVWEGLRQSTLPSGWTAARGGNELRVTNTMVTPGREAELVCNYREIGPGARYKITLSASRRVPHGLSCKALGTGFYCRRSK